MKSTTAFSIGRRTGNGVIAIMGGLPLCEGWYSFELHQARDQEPEFKDVKFTPADEKGWEEVRRLKSENLVLVLEDGGMVKGVMVCDSEEPSVLLSGPMLPALPPAN